MSELKGDVKFLVTRNIILFTSILMGILTVVNFINGGNNFKIALIAFIASCALLLLTIKLKSHLIPSIISILVAYCVNFFNLTRGSNFENYIDLFWLINLSLFAYFTLGKTVGKIYLAINMLTILSISILEKLDYIQLVPPSFIYDVSSYIDLSLNLAVSTLFFGYLLSQFLVQTERANQQITDYNTELNKQHEEKSIMLKEIHHRVKNNLQVITSLLRLQLYKIDSDIASAPFNESIDRISSMALIHEKMYQDDQVKNIDLKEYIEDLAKSLTENYAFKTKIELKIESSVKSIDLNHIVPFSLILNELITNSIKHGFKDSKNGIISIKLSKTTEGLIALNFQDNGIWRPQLDQNSFGLELIETFTEQIGGEYKLKTSTNTEYNFTFPDINIGV